MQASLPASVRAISSFASGPGAAPAECQVSPGARVGRDAGREDDLVELEEGRIRLERPRSQWGPLPVPSIGALDADARAVVGGGAARQVTHGAHSRGTSIDRVVQGDARTPADEFLRAGYQEHGFSARGEELLTEAMAITDLARPAVVTVPPKAGATHVAELMEEESVGSVVVVEDDRPVGLVTDRDLALEVVSRGRDPAGLTAADVMTPDPFTVAEDESIYEALRRTRDAGVRRVPVVADDGTLSGIVTLDDFTVLLSSEFANVSDVVQAESPPY